MMTIMLKYVIIFNGEMMHMYEKKAMVIFFYPRTAYCI